MSSEVLLLYLKLGKIRSLLYSAFGIEYSVNSDILNFYRCPNHQSLIAVNCS